MTPSTENVNKKSARPSTQDKSMREFTEIYKKKFEASEELKSVGIFVQKAMMTKNKELTELAVLQKIDILQRQIDSAEDRPNFDPDNPSARWIFSTNALAKVVGEYEMLKADPVTESDDSTRNQSNRLG